MSWSVATVAAARMETERSRTLTLSVDGWAGHIAGQHVDVRLTAEDGYTAVRSYSIAASALSSLLEITVDRLDDGEVSPYLVDGVAVGDRVEVRGPAGGWFVWRRDQVGPVQLIGGGSGIVPLMAMMRTHADAASSAPFRALYSVRTPGEALYRAELLELEARDAALDVTWAFTRQTPEGWSTPPARLDASSVAAAVFPPELGASVFVCGSTPFVEKIADILVASGHDPALVRTERFGGLGT